MDDAEDHAEAIREMWMQEVHMNEDGGGDGNDYAFDPGEKSSGYRRRMAGERTGMHEVDGASSGTSGGSNRSGSSAYRRRMAEEADEENKEQIWRDQMEEQGAALEAGIKGNQDLTAERFNRVDEALAGALARLEEIEGKGEPFVRWTPDVEEDAFLCVYPGDTDGSDSVLVNPGDCYVDGVAATGGEWLTDTTISATEGVIYMKYVISTDIWEGPTHGATRLAPDDDIRYFYLCELVDEGGDVFSIKPLRRGDIHYETGASSTSFIAKFTDEYGLIWKKQTFSETAGTFTNADPVVTGSLATNTKDANGNIKMEQGLMVMMHEINTSGSWKYVFFHPVPYLEECESVTALVEGNPVAATTLIPAIITSEGSLSWSGCGKTGGSSYNECANENDGYPKDTRGIVSGQGIEGDPYLFHAAIPRLEHYEVVTAKADGMPEAAYLVFPAKITSEGSLYFTALDWDGEVTNPTITGEAECASGNDGYPEDARGFVSGSEADGWMFHATIPYMEKCEVITARVTGYPIAALHVFPAQISSSGGLDWSGCGQSGSSSDTTSASGNSGYPPNTGGIISVNENVDTGAITYVFHAAIPYMEQYEVITALEDGDVDVTNVRVSST